VQQEINIDEQIKQQSRILTDLADLDAKNFTTKKDYIIQLKDVTRPLILSGYYQDMHLSDFCSLISDILEKYNISYPRTKLPELFDDDEKRVYNKGGNNVTKSDNEIVPLSTEDRGIIGQLDFLEKQIGKSYDSMDTDPADKLDQLESIAAKSVSHIKSFTKKLFQAHHFVDSFEKQFDIDEIDKILQGLPKKQRNRLEVLSTIYHANILMITEMESNLIDITQIKELQAKQKIISRDIDERNKISSWEKLMIVLVMKAADIAKNQCARLTGIDKKHITNNIYPEQSPTETKTKNKHHDYISYFKQITIKLGGKDYTFDLTRWFDEQVERKKLNLEFKPLVLETAKVV